MSGRRERTWIGAVTRVLAAAVSTRLRVLILCVVPIGAAVIAGAVPWLTPPAGWWRLAAAFGLLTAATAARLRVRLAGERFHLGWGEAGLTVALFLVPAGWLPLLAAAAGAIGTAVHSLDGEHMLYPVGRPARIAYNAATKAIAAAVAASVAVPLGVHAGVALTPRIAGAAVLAAVGYNAVTALATALYLHAAYGGRISANGLTVNLLMLIGNISVGLLVVGAGLTDPRWLILVPPLLWLLHQLYDSRLRAGENRRLWRELAAATAGLDHPDPHEVVVAALRGARRLFRPEHVAVVVPGAAGSPYTMGRPARGAEVTRTLPVGGGQPGELRLGFANAVLLDECEQMALSAYADAVGGALRHSLAAGRLRAISECTGHDPLTGLADRATLLVRGDEVLRGLDEAGHAALLLFDLDKFKDVNDTLGHAAGDDLLRAAGGRLEAHTGPGELLARLGGDEFALLMPVPADHADPAEFALERARTCATALAQPIMVAGLTLSVEVSVGAVAAPTGCPMAELLRRADVAMYQAKRGCTTVVAYDAARDAASTDRLALLAELRTALGVDDQLVLAVQPAVDLATGGPMGVEALIRWNHPRRGLLAPDEFVGVVEQSDLVGPFTRYVIDEALRVAATWAAEGIDVPVAVNLSARSLLDTGLPVEIAELLARHAIPPPRLVLEITETVAMADSDVIDEVLAALRLLGVQIAVDDFGTGYSSMAFLARFQVDEVKVDRGFVGRMVESQAAAAIVRHTVELGRSLGLRVVAEGVETAEQRAALAALGCTAAQGFHFYRPMSVDKAAAVLRDLTSQASARVIPFNNGAESA